MVQELVQFRSSANKALQECATRLASKPSASAALSVLPVELNAMRRRENDRFWRNMHRFCVIRPHLILVQENWRCCARQWPSERLPPQHIDLVDGELRLAETSSKRQHPFTLCDLVRALDLLEQAVITASRDYPSNFVLSDYIDALALTPFASEAARAFMLRPENAPLVLSLWREQVFLLLDFVSRMCMWEKVRRYAKRAFHPSKLISSDRPCWAQALD
jgi:hypothetical protein